MSKTTVFELMVCNLCDCGQSALSVRTEGRCGGLRLTESSNSIWRTVETIEPGDPRYRRCIELLESEVKHGPHKGEARRYLDHLPKVDDLEAMEAEWMAEWRGLPLGNLHGLEWGAWDRLMEGGITTLGALADHTQKSLVKDVKGVGWATAMAVARAFSRNQIKWSEMRSTP